MSVEIEDNLFNQNSLSIMTSKEINGDKESWKQKWAKKKEWKEEKRKCVENKYRGGTTLECRQTDKWTDG